MNGQSLKASLRGHAAANWNSCAAIAPSQAHWIDYEKKNVDFQCGRGEFVAFLDTNIQSFHSTKKKKENMWIFSASLIMANEFAPKKKVDAVFNF